jgi:hypothetical protein
MFLACGSRSMPNTYAKREGLRLWRVGRASDQEGLRLMLAYLQIPDPELRKQVVRLAEKLAGVPQPPIPSIAQDNFETHSADVADLDNDGGPKLDPSR